MTIRYFLLLFGLLFFALGINLLVKHEYIRPNTGIISYRTEWVK